MRDTWHRALTCYWCCPTHQRQQFWQLFVKRRVQRSLQRWHVRRAL
eukprot:CAMPEP_0184561766 /NCGR_PEP_ID=MMETSP0199_2-20130426/47613_1 /TAXON_ID=1112570 /ORGANISM="Thraustochytrium sp., Strain LLF1b" /LENGTH=45 /DNA_ID= /DNA_START= /DNA_END= /DNA_ORIENTATION=